MNRISASVVLAVLAALMAAIHFSGVAEVKSWPADYRAAAGFRVPAREFPLCCLRPAWWAEVDAPRTIATMEDFQIVWRDKSLRKREQGKAIFQAIGDHVHTDDDITATMVNSFYYTDRNYPQLTELLEFAVGRYFHLDRSLENYSGKKGDTSAGLVNKLAREYNKAGRHEEAANLLVAFITEREADVNHHLLETASLQLAEALDGSGRAAEAYAVLGYAIRRYDGSWEEKLIEARAGIGSRLGLKSYLLGFLKSGVGLFFPVA